MDEKLCRYCDLPVEPKDTVTVHAYWAALQRLPNGKLGNTPHVAHRACRDKGYAAEVYECQCIDADCNDCRHFQRGPLVGKDIFTGTCLKFSRQTYAQPNKWSGYECFEHRKKPLTENNSADNLGAL